MCVWNYRILIINGDSSLVGKGHSGTPFSVIHTYLKHCLLIYLCLPSHTFFLSFIRLFKWHNAFWIEANDVIRYKIQTGSKHLTWLDVMWNGAVHSCKQSVWCSDLFCWFIILKYSVGDQRVYNVSLIRPIKNAEISVLSPVYWSIKKLASNVYKYKTWCNPLLVKSV